MAIMINSSQSFDGELVQIKSKLPIAEGEEVYFSFSSPKDKADLKNLYLLISGMVRGYKWWLSWDYTMLVCKRF